MPEENDNGADAGTQDAGNGDDKNQQAGNDGQQNDDYSELRGALDKERDAHKTTSKELRTIRAKLSELEGAGKSDLEKLAKDRDDLKAQLADLSGKVRESTARDAVFAQARKLGSPKPDLVWRLVRHDLEYDDEGNATNLDAVMKDARNVAPEMFRASGGGDAGSGTGSPSGSTDWLRQAFEARR